MCKVVCILQKHVEQHTATLVGHVPHAATCSSERPLVQCVSACWQPKPLQLRADCCSLQWIHANGGGANHFGSATKFGHYLFVDCINLATFALQEGGRNPELQNQKEAREPPPGCLGSTGIKALELTGDFQVLGAHACDNCKLLTQVDLSNT